MVASRHHDQISELFDSKLSIGDQVQFKVISNSMAPLIQAGDLVVADIINSHMIKQGDILIIRREADFLTHRAIKPVDDGWVTKGDNTIQFDPPSKERNIIGRVAYIKKSRQIIKFKTRKWTSHQPGNGQNRRGRIQSLYNYPHFAIAFSPWH